MASQLGRSASSGGSLGPCVALYTHLVGAVQIRLSQRNSSATVSEVCRRWEFRFFNIQACRLDRRQRLAQELPAHQACRGEHHAISHARYHVMHHAALGHTTLNFTVKRTVHHSITAGAPGRLLRQGRLSGRHRPAQGASRSTSRKESSSCAYSRASMHGW